MNPADCPLPKSETDFSTDGAGSDSYSAPASKRERRISVALSVFAFFISYVITAGPAVFMVRKFDMPTFGAIVEVLYAPLVFIVKIETPVIAPLIKAWVSLFR
jgi:hypothetical protein